MTKVMYVDTVITVFIFLFFIFGKNIYARRGAYLMMVYFPQTLGPLFLTQSNDLNNTNSPAMTHTQPTQPTQNHAIQ